MINKIAVCLLLLLSFQGFSQEKIYLDENMKEIDSLQFSLRCKNHNFKCLDYNSDIIKVSKIHPKYKFGKITPEEYNQIRNILQIDSKTKISPESNLVIYYRDSLLNEHTSYKRFLSKFNKKKFIIYLKNGFSLKTAPNNKKLNKKRFYNFYQKTQNYSKKCVERFDRINNVHVSLMYNNKQEGISDFENLLAIKDRGFFKNTFFKEYYKYRLLILKPDGEYFLNGSYLTNENINQLLKNKDWNSYKIDLQRLENVDDIYYYNGFFNDPFLAIETKHCF